MLCVRAGCHRDVMLCVRAGCHRDVMLCVRAGCHRDVMLCVRAGCHCDVTLQVTAPLMSLPPRHDTLQLKTNPLQWSVKKVVEFMKTTDCAGLSKIFNDQVCKCLYKLTIIYNNVD